MVFGRLAGPAYSWFFGGILARALPIRTHQKMVHQIHMANAEKTINEVKSNANADGAVNIKSSMTGEQDIVQKVMCRIRPQKGNF